MQKQATTSQPEQKSPPGAPKKAPDKDTSNNSLNSLQIFQNIGLLDDSDQIRLISQPSEQFLPSQESPKQPHTRNIKDKTEDPRFRTFGFEEEDDRTGSNQENIRSSGNQKDIARQTEQRNKVMRVPNLQEGSEAIRVYKQNVSARKQSNEFEIKLEEVAKQQNVETKTEVRQKHQPPAKQIQVYEQRQSPPISPSTTNKNGSPPETECFLEINSKKWQRCLLKLSKTRISLGPITIDIEKILKIKMFPIENSEEPKFSSHELGRIEPYKQNTLKITTADNSTFQFYQRYPSFIASLPKVQFSNSTLPCTQTGNSTLPLPFLTLSRLILRKLRQLYPAIKSSEWHVPESLPRPILHSNSHSTATRNYAYIHGKIYKKSQHRGSWEKRYIIVNDSGIYSYKDEKQEYFSYSIDRREVRYLWTWFTILKVDKESDRHEGEIRVADNQESKGWEQGRNPEVEQPDTKNNYLIVKVKHGFNGQTEFGIPICGFDNEMNKSRNWLLAFFRLMSQSQL